MGPRRLDRAGAEALLSRRGAPPPGYEGVARVLGSLTRLRAAPEVDEALLTRMQAAVPASAAGMTVAPPAPSLRRRPVFALAGVVIAGFVLFGGLAAGGALPDGAQRFAGGVLGNVGISVPDPADHPTAKRSIGTDDGDLTPVESTETPTAPTASDLPGVQGLCIAYTNGQNGQGAKLDATAFVRLRDAARAAPNANVQADDATVVGAYCYEAVAALGKASHPAQPNHPTHPDHPTRPDHPTPAANGNGNGNGHAHGGGPPVK